MLRTSEVALTRLSSSDMAEHAPRPDDPLVFASLRLCNEAGRKAMHHLGENYPTLSDHHRRYLHVQRIGMSLIPLSLDTQGALLNVSSN